MPFRPPLLKSDLRPCLRKRYKSVKRVGVLSGVLDGLRWSQVTYQYFLL